MGIPPSASKTQDEVNMSEAVSEDMRAADTNMKQEYAQPSDSTIAASERQGNDGVINNIHQDPEQNASSAVVVSDDAAWSVWTTTEKKLIILAAGVASFFSPISAQIYFPALNTIAADLKVSNTLINLTITTYMLMQGLAPTFIGQFADNAGRRPAYMICFIVYIAANIGLAVQDSYPALMVLRCLQSAGSSGTVSLGNAVVADLVTSSERGIYVAFLSVAPQVGPSLGPVIGGLLAQYAGWHFIFWFLVILAAAVFVPMLFLFPETCRKIVGDGSIPPVAWNRCYTNRLQERKAIKAGETIPYEKRDELAQNRRLRFPNPFATLKLLLQRECGYALLYIALVGCGMYGTVAMIPSQFGEIYRFNELQISLCYIPIGVGSMLAAFVRGRMIDSRFRYHAERLGIPVVRNRRTDLTNFPIEKARLEVAVPTAFLGSACMIGFGWTVQYKTNLAGPLILLFFIGFCASSTVNAVAVLTIDLYPGKAGTVSAANNLMRCWLGAGSTALVVPMINAMGVGWTCTFFGLLVLGLSPMLWYIMRQGPKWRRERQQKRLEKQAGTQKNPL